jgi:hypothetical protein
VRDETAMAGSGGADGVGTVGDGGAKSDANAGWEWWATLVRRGWAVVVRDLAAQQGLPGRRGRKFRYH